MKRQLLCAVSAIVAMTWSADASAQRLSVFVTTQASPSLGKPTEADRQQASAAYDTANNARKALEKSLKTQFGNKRDKWPAEAQERLLAAEDAVTLANTEWLYRTDAEPLDNSWAIDIAKGLTHAGRTGKKEHVTPASSAAEAQLIVTITAVRNPSAAINAADNRCLAVRLDAGPKMSAAQFSAVPRTYRPVRSNIKRLAAPSDGAPFWRFDGCGLDPYSSTEEAVANIVNDFVGAHRDVLLSQAAR